MSTTPALGGAASGFRRMWHDLESLGLDDESGGYHRFAWTREDHDLREWFAGECAQRGLDLTTDRMGNQWAWWGDPDAAVAAGDPGVVIGSHLDSVPNGGAFDGPLGVVGALAAVDQLRHDGFVPSRPVGVVNFADEEGARFGVACAGSRVITGALGADRARGLTDRDGVTMAEAMQRAGRDPATLGRDDETLARVGTFVELHVEQGRALVDLGHAVGVGSDIWPHGRWRVDVPGEANHAGTTRLDDREDAMLGLAAMVIAARRAAEQAGLRRHRRQGARRARRASTPSPAAPPGGSTPAAPTPMPCCASSPRCATSSPTSTGWSTQESWTPVTDFDPALVRRMATLLGGLPVIGTGAGHDAGILANDGIRTAMLFVRNPTGVSHSPDEWASADDCLAGIAALADVVTDLAGAGA